MAWPYEDLIAKQFLPYFQKHGQAGLPFLVNGKISNQSFLAIYKSLDPIEEMTESEKKKLKKTVIEMFPEKNEAEMMDACKIIYTIGAVSQFVTE